MSLRLCSKQRNYKWSITIQTLTWSRQKPDQVCESWSSEKALCSSLCGIWLCVPWGSSSACVKTGNHWCHKGYRPASRRGTMTCPSGGWAAFHRGCSVWTTGTCGDSSCRLDRGGGETGCWVWKATGHKEENRCSPKQFMQMKIYCWPNGCLILLWAITGNNMTKYTNYSFHLYFLYKTQENKKQKGYKNKTCPFHIIRF